MRHRGDDLSPGGRDPTAFASRHGDLVRESAVFLEACGTKLLKLEYPGSPAACEAVSAAITTPWAVLSAGVDHEEFRDQLSASVRGGAAGFIAGRLVEGVRAHAGP